MDPSLTLRGRLSVLTSPETVVGIAFLGIVSLLIIPVPAFVLDALLALSIAVSAVVFLTALFSERPTDFSVFPTLLLGSTLLRLSLNIASTRLILLKGHEGPDAAGGVIRAFADFVVGGNVWVGLIIFVALVVINFVVITKGAGRIAEVAARFTLDAMPGKQMAIDAELNAGTINEVEARKRRSELEQQADFYGAMDGSNKFIRGDAVAGLIITGINLVGGLAIGILQQGLAPLDAISTYSALTVGDGLVSQMPALVVSTAAGIAITRASGRSELGRDVMKQMLATRAVLGIAAGFLVLLGFLPGLPPIPFLGLAAILSFISFKRGQTTRAAAAATLREERDRPVAEPDVSEALRVAPLVLEIGMRLTPYFDSARGGEVPGRIKKLRMSLAEEIGVVMPPVSVRSLATAEHTYTVELYGTVVGKGEIHPGRLLAIDTAGLQSFPNGIETKEPTFGCRAWWILPDDKSRAEGRGLMVVDPASVVITHLQEILRTHADQLLGRDELHELIGYVKRESPKLVEELIPALVSVSEVLVVLKALLSEGVGIRNLRAIFEALSVTSKQPGARDPSDLVAAARVALSRQITASVTSDTGEIRYITLSRSLETALRSSVTPRGQLAPEGELLLRINRQTADIMETVEDPKLTPIVVSPELRRPIRDLMKTHFPNVPVLAFSELDSRAAFHEVGSLSA